MSRFVTDLVFDTEPYDSPDDDGHTITVTIDGDDYVARRPQPHVLEDVAFTLSQLASDVDKGFALRGLLQDVLSPTDWARIKARLDDRNDPLVSYFQLANAAIGICNAFGADTREWTLSHGGEDGDAVPPANRAARRDARYGRPHRQRR